jgi:hypothetical protein
MRQIVLLLATVALALPGCIDVDENPPVAPETEEDEPVLPVLPEDIKDSKMVQASSALLGAGLSPIVYQYSFDVDPNEPSAVKVDAKVTWSLEANDIDLYLYKDGATEPEAFSNDYPPKNYEAFQSSLKPGKYHLRVVAYAVVTDTFQLEAKFSR